MQSEVLNVINDLKLDMTASPVDDVTIITRAQLEALEAALSAAEPIRWMWEERRFAESDIWDDMYDDDPPAPHKHVRNIRPLYAAPPAPSVAVKALEWVEHQVSFPCPLWSAEMSFGVYSIEEASASDSPVYEVRLHANKMVAIKDSLSDAKAAAQADYEARIRSALSAQVQDVTDMPQSPWPASDWAIGRIEELEAQAIPEGWQLVPKEPTHAMISAMAESKAKDDEGEFLCLSELLDFSGENKTHTVLKAAYRAALPAAPAKQEGGHD